MDVEIKVNEKTKNQIKIQCDYLFTSLVLTTHYLSYIYRNKKN